MSKHRSQGGFTLLEMMIAMGILAVSYVALMEAASMSMRLSTFGKQITLATFLAQSKMEETEQTLTKEGFPDMDDSEEGTFEEQGYPAFKWRLEVNKVELPLAQAFGQLLNNFGGGEEGGAGAAGAAGALGGMAGLEDKLGGQLGDQLKGQLGGMMGGGGAGGGIAGMLNPEMLAGQVEQLATMLEQALREVQLTVYWEGGGPGKELVLTTHLVQVPSAPGAGGMPGAPGAGGDVASQLQAGQLKGTGKTPGTMGSGGPLGPGGGSTGPGGASKRPLSPGGLK